MDLCFQVIGMGNIVDDLFLQTVATENHIVQLNQAVIGNASSLPSFIISRRD